MTPTHQPVVFQYQRALDDFRRAGEASPLLKRMSELISLLDLTTTLNSTLSRDEFLDAALLIVMGELQAFRGCILVRDDGNAYEVVASHGLPAGTPRRLEAVHIGDRGVVRRGAGSVDDALAALGLEVLCPVARHDRAGTAAAAPLALLG